MAITLYALDDSRSIRVEWVLKELKLEYTIEQYYRDADTKAPAAFKKVHSLGQFPVLKDGDLTIAESGLIITYLINKYGGSTDLLGSGEAEKLHVAYGVLSAETGFASFSSQLNINKIARTKLPWAAATIGKKVLDQIDNGYPLPHLEDCLNQLQDTIQANNGFYSKGHLTAADIMYWFHVKKTKARGFFKDFDKKWPTLAKYANDMDELYIKADAANSGLVVAKHEHK